MLEVGLYNVEVLVHLKYSLIVMITCSVGAEIASVLKTLYKYTFTRISGFTVSSLSYRYLS